MGGIRSLNRDGIFEYGFRATAKTALGLRNTSGYKTNTPCTTETVKWGAGSATGNEENATGDGVRVTWISPAA